MIVYKTRDWLQAIWHFHRSGTIISLQKRLVFVALYVAVIYVLERYFFEIRLTNTPTEFFSAMGVLLSLLLVFRTNTAYDRFYEGRRTWGQLVNTSRNLAVLFDAILPEDDKANRQFFGRTVANFPFALRNHLRAITDPDDIEGDDVEDPLELMKFGHAPNAVVARLRRRVEAMARDGSISNAQSINLNDLIVQLLDVAGICERIKSTPIPFSYSFFIKIFITVYIIVEPFTILDEYGIVTIPAVVITSYILIGLEMIGEEIEEPFGTEYNDLPLTQLSHMIRVNVYCLMGLRVPREEKKAAQPDFLVVE